MQKSFTFIFVGSEAAFCGDSFPLGLSFKPVAPRPLANSPTRKALFSPKVLDYSILRSLDMTLAFFHRSVFREVVSGQMEWVFASPPIRGGPSFFVFLSGLALFFRWQAFLPLVLGLPTGDRVFFGFFYFSFDCFFCSVSCFCILFFPQDFWSRAAFFFLRGPTQVRSGAFRFSEGMRSLVPCHWNTGSFPLAGF